MRKLLVILVGGLMILPIWSGVQAQEDDVDNPFTLAQDEAVVSPGLSDGEWDIKWINPGAMTYHDDQFHMFRNGFGTWPGFVSTGYTVSADGLQWEAVGDEPVIDSDAVPYAGVLIMPSSVLVEEDGTWVLYFYNWERRRAPMGGGGIGRATAPAPEGPWTPDEELVLTPGSEGEWDAGQVSVPSVLKTESGYVMYYSGFSDTIQMNIGLATSPDGISWTKYDDPETTEAPFAESDPVFTLPEDDAAWDSAGVERPRVVQTDDGWAMVYRTPQPSALGLALSENGISWTRHPANPIVTPATFPENGRSVWFPSLVHHDDTFYLYIEAITLANPGKSEVFLLTHEGPLSLE